MFVLFTQKACIGLGERGGGAVSECITWCDAVDADLDVFVAKVKGELAGHVDGCGFADLGVGVSA